MKLLITGGAGFIGSAFVKEALKDGYDTVVVDALTYAGDLKRIKDVYDNMVFYKIDITDKDSLKDVFIKEKPNIIIHFAAESHVDRSILDPYIFIKTNVEGTFNLLELSREFNIEKFINISTDEVYGDIEQGEFYEESCLKPSSPYSTSKASADMLGRAYYRTYNLPVVTVRPSNNYGPWQYPEKFIPVVILKALNNEKIPIYGTGQNVREWLFVEDCAKGVLKIMQKGKIGEIYNLGSDIELKNIDVAKTILRLLNKDKSLISFVKDRKGHDIRYKMNSSKLKEEIGFSLSTSFEEGIKKTIDWYIENMDWVKKKINYLEEYWKKVYI